MCLLAGSTFGLRAQKSVPAKPIGLTEAIEQFKKKEKSGDVQISRSVDRTTSPRTGRFQSSITTYRFKLSRRNRKKVLDPLIDVFMDNAERAYKATTISPDTPDNAENIRVSIDDTGKTWEFPSRKGKTIVGIAFVHEDDADLRDYYLLRWFDAPDEPDFIEGQIYHILSKRPDLIEKEKNIKQRVWLYWVNCGKAEKKEILRMAMKDNLPPSSIMEDMVRRVSPNELPDKVVQFISKFWAE